jgi:hypothetical protein
MTIKKLIEELSKYPPNMDVMIDAEVQGFTGNWRTTQKIKFIKKLDELKTVAIRI